MPVIGWLNGEIDGALAVRMYSHEEHGVPHVSLRINDRQIRYLIGVEQNEDQIIGEIRGKNRQALIQWVEQHREELIRRYEARMLPSFSQWAKENPLL